jgi:RNA polymerase sigma factor (sigma-70 family)
MNRVTDQMTDEQALADFAKTRSAQAFTALVQRYVDLVYSTAARVARDAHLAEDATQAVFIVLARRANSINPKYLAGWLVNTARLASRDALRSRNRQQKHEAEAAQMRSEIASDEEPTAQQIAPLLDDALARLSEADRSSVVMRFLQGQSFADVGQALGISDEAARKRVERAIEKLRSILCKQGVVPSIGGLAITLAAHQASPAPPSLAIQAAGVMSSHSAGAASVAKGVVWTMSIAKAQVAVVTILVSLAVIGGGVTVIVASESPRASGTAATLPTSQPAVVGEKIEPNDRLRIKIANLVAPGMLTTLSPRVDPSGQISLPIIGQIYVEGEVPSEVEVEIRKAYFDANILRNAQVNVEFDERGSQISILSGPFQIGDHLLLNVVGVAGTGVQTTKLCVVDANGDIDAPLLRNVKVQGLTEFGAEKAMANAYHSANLIQSAQVSVERISAKEANEISVP